MKRTKQLHEQADCVQAFVGTARLQSAAARRYTLAGVKKGAELTYDYGNEYVKNCKHLLV